MKKLVLAEKPSVGKDIANALNCNQKGNGYFEGNKYIVTWAFGHLVTLANPKDYDKKYEKWDMNDLPMMPTRFKLKVIPKSHKQFNQVKKLMQRTDVGEIIIGTDAGREGELVARWIIEKAGVKKPMKRLWISSVTKKAIVEGFNNLQDAKNYRNLYYSAVARSEADWLVGLNASRALTTKHNVSLSCGRVQTPTLGIIKYREDEIKSFKPKKHYGVELQTSTHTFTLSSGTSFDESYIDQIIKDIKGKTLSVVDRSKKIKKEYPKQLYDLTSLQSDANKIFSYSPKETLKIMQSLYEHHKVLTYPRTDSKYISTDIIPTLKERIESCIFDDVKDLATSVLTAGIKTNKSFVDNNKVSDHHAIIPTEQEVYIDDLSVKEFNIYTLVVNRFLSVFLPPYVYELNTVKGRVGKHEFTAKYQVVIDKGFKTDSLSQQSIIDDVLNIIQVKKTTHETKPPKRFTEGTILEAMENPSKFMKKKDLVETIKTTGGLGTVATRSDILEKLFQHQYIEKNGKELFTTGKGRQLLDLAPSELRYPDLTAKWEEELTLIAKGKSSSKEFIEDIKKYTDKIVAKVKEDDSEFKHDNLTGKTCPDCGKFLIEVKSKHGLRYECVDKTCGYRKNQYKITNARCPVCHKKLKLYGEGENKTFSCSCGHREKMTSFNKRKQEKNKTMSKKEVNKYLKKQKQDDEPNAFAEAFANFNFDD